MSDTRGAIRRGIFIFSSLTLGAAVSLSVPAGSQTDSSTHVGPGSSGRWGASHARLIATGIPGAGAVAEVGDFLRGSPLRDKAAFVAFTQPGQVLDPRRVLVASSSNFGGPPARPGDPEGSILSIDPASAGVAVPVGFASAGGQASALGGAILVYAAQGPAFLNSIFEPKAATAALPSASLPLGISLNNGNGRPWIANAPNGASGAGTITVLDPQGYPLAGAPDQTAGGVFAGTATNRDPSAAHGLTSAALGTAIIAKSPDLTGRAVFAAVEADGSVVQINVAKGVDDLAPPGTVTPLAVVDRTTAESNSPRVVARAGIAFNWVPTQNLFVADPQGNRLVVLDLGNDGVKFTATVRQIRREEFDVPIDVAPTTREVSSGSFASNTTLAGASDLYVLNRGNNSVVRMTIDGDVVAGRYVEADIRGFRVNGIAVSSDGQTIYLTATSAGRGGVLMSIPAFGQAPVTASLVGKAQTAGQANDMTALGTFLFGLDFSPSEGLGPLFNDASCAGCHASPFPGGMGTRTGQDERFVGRVSPSGAFDDLSGRGGPVARAHSIAELGSACRLPTGVPPFANATSLRNAMTLRGNGLIDDVAAGDILANMNTQPTSVRGRPNLLPDGRVGKFGWKANVATLVEFMGIAFRNEMGVTNPLQPLDEVHGCGADRGSPEVDALILQGAAKFLNTLDPPVPPAACTTSPGAALFVSTGCASCHTPLLPGPGARQPINLYSDLLLHRMGPALADRIAQASAAGDEWRTMPLWRVSERTKFMHDGRARTLTDAILAHDGQAGASRDAFSALDAASKQAVIDFLGCI